MKTAIYFAALIPGEDIQKEVTEFKQYAKKHFQTERALTSPPHVTVIAPFKFETEKISEVEEMLEAYGRQIQAPEVELKDFSTFGDRVIFVDVVPSEALDDIHFALNTAMEEYFSVPFKFKDETFHGHMTVAFKDLKKSIFPEAWAHYRSLEYRRTFKAGRLTLLKHNGKCWDIYKEFEFLG